MTENRFMIKAVMLDIMSLLDRSQRVPKNGLYLDGDMPLLSGKVNINDRRNDDLTLTLLFYKINFQGNPHKALTLYQKPEKSFLD